MKKTLLLAACLMTCGMTMAQQGYKDMQEASFLTDRNPALSARTMAMGNAFMALGGDIGGISINPAGSAVNQYSQFSITGNWTQSISSSSMNMYRDPSFSGKNNISFNRNLDLMNFGYIGSIFFGDYSFVKRISYGISFTNTNAYTGSVVGKGRNSHTSYFASEAASGIKGNPRTDYLTDNRLISVYENNGKADYVGVTESINNSKYSQAGDIDQKYTKRINGYKREIQVNLGMDMGDFLYLGANIGFHSARYRDIVSVTEYAVNKNDFRLEFESDGKRTEDFFLEGNFTETAKINTYGTYAKFGAIIVPQPWLRLGFTYETVSPLGVESTYNMSAYNILEKVRYNIADRTDYTNRLFLMTPSIYGAGVAFVVKNGLFSVDYEVSDYSGMKLMNDSGEIDEGAIFNKIASNFYGFKHTLRFGGEYRFFDMVAVRFGYNLFSSPECLKKDGNKILYPEEYEAKYRDESISNEDFNKWENSLSGKIYSGKWNHNFSFGMGFGLSTPFFCDIAMRYGRSTFYTLPYPNYIKDVKSPEIKTRQSLVECLLTVGYRF